MHNFIAKIGYRLIRTRSVYDNPKLICPRLEKYYDHIEYKYEKIPENITQADIENNCIKKNTLAFDEFKSMINKECKIVNIEIIPKINKILFMG